MIYTQHLTAEIRPEGRLLRRARSPGKVAYDVQHEEGDSFFRKTGKWHRLTRIIDRTRDWYYEHIVDAETGELIRFRDERLSEHRKDEEAPSRDVGSHD